MTRVMHLNEVFACLALISSVLVYVVLHFHGIYQEFGFGLAPFWLGMWRMPCTPPMLGDMFCSHFAHPWATCLPQGLRLMGPRVRIFLSFFSSDPFPVADVRAVVHFTQKGYPIWYYGDAFGYPVQGPPLHFRLSDPHVHINRKGVPGAVLPSPRQLGRGLIASPEAKRCDPSPSRHATTPSTLVFQPHEASRPSGSPTMAPSSEQNTNKRGQIHVLIQTASWKQFTKIHQHWVGGCSMVCISKNIAKCSKNLQFLPATRALFAH